ncbi:MAG: hypothetical protein KGQ88_06825, partial [Chloroflexi bacterium]|nr:hypothetical protein [Chloroflexota bacterium]
MSRRRHRRYHGRHGSLPRIALALPVGELRFPRPSIALPRWGARWIAGSAAAAAILVASLALVAGNAAPHAVARGAAASSAGAVSL